MFHGFSGVLEEIYQNLLYLNSVDHDSRQAPLDGNPHSNATFLGINLSETDRFIDSVRDILAGPVRPALFDKAAQAADDISGTRGLLRHFPENRFHFGVAALLSGVETRIGVIQNCGQRL